jgi:hypothetical protein
MNSPDELDKKQRLHKSLAEIDEYLGRLCFQEKTKYESCLGSGNDIRLSNLSKCRSLQEEMNKCHKLHMSQELFNSFLARNGVELNRPKSILDLFSFDSSSILKDKKS